MGKKIKEVDAYIERSPDFAQPMLKKMRRLFHKASPKINETIKWGVPHFEYKGLVGGMAAFKRHVTLGFWKSELMSDPAQLFQRGPKASMCTAKFKAAGEMPPDGVLLDYIRQAVKLNEDEVKLTKKKRENCQETPRARGSGGRAQVEQTGPGELQRLQPQRSTGIHRMDHGGQTGIHPQSPADPGDRVDRRRQTA